MTTSEATIPGTEPRPPRGHPVKPSGRSKWRATVLIVLHIAIAVHVLHWLSTGSTLTPIEPSESMQTLENGLINAGFVFLAVSVLLTLLLGRWFCGWMCHVVAYQDFAAWVLGRFGVRPKPVRSRLLLWAPILLAFYMFVWPQFTRLFEGRAFPGFEQHWTTSRFWDSFAGPGMAIVTILVCGALVVYWLGAKGFCTYGCPYGAFYGIADRFSPGRIRVTDACRGCRHCTATCTSNVLVHEEVLRFGMVVDPGCMKCMDCVNVCPEDALYFGFGKPAIGARERNAKPQPASAGSARFDTLIFVTVWWVGTWWIWVSDLDQRLPLWFETITAAAFAGLMAWQGRRKKTFDFTRGEELAMAAIFLLSSQWAFRMLYGLVPNLLAMGLGVLTASVAIVLWRMWTQPEFVMQHHTLRAGGRLTRSGRAFAVVGGLWLVFSAHSYFIQDQVRAAEQTIVDIKQLAPQDTTARATLLARAEDRIATIDRWALRDNTHVRHMAGGIAFVKMDLERAAREFQRAVDLEPKNITAWLRLSDVYGNMRDATRARRALEAMLEAHPDNEEARRRLAMIPE